MNSSEAPNSWMTLSPSPIFDRPARTAATEGAFSKRHLQNLRQMKRLPVGSLRDLFPAAKAVRDHQPVGGRSPDSRSWTS